MLCTFIPLRVLAQILEKLVPHRQLDLAVPLQRLLIELLLRYLAPSFPPQLGLPTASSMCIEPLAQLLEPNRPPNLGVLDRLLLAGGAAAASAEAPPDPVGVLPCPLPIILKLAVFFAF